MSKGTAFLSFWCLFCVYSYWSINIFAYDTRDARQQWGYIAVRPNAHMFWWLHLTTANVSRYTERPLIMWLQGGPGMPSTGYGNFLEIGPFNMNLKQRSHTWVNHFNILFVDNPVGVGFSYFSNASAKLVENNEEVAQDLVSFAKAFFDVKFEFRGTPFYVFGESYGGKMAVDFAYQLQKKIKTGDVEAELKGIGLGDAYISPLHYIFNYGSFALNLGLVDKKGFDEIEQLIKQIQEAIENEDFETASDIESKITDTIVKTTQGIDVYNIVFKSNQTALPRFLSYQDSFNRLMNSRVRQFLNLPANLTWNFINDDVYSSLQNDLMRPVTTTIEALLNETDIKIIVYNGVFDFLVNTAGTVMWLDNLKWEHSSEWHKTQKQTLEIDMVTEAYVKQVRNLVFYTVLRAGHSVPIDNVAAMQEILRRELLVVPKSVSCKSKTYGV